MPRTEKPRVYTPLDEEVEQALASAPDLGLVGPGASRAERLRALALHGARSLTEAREREQKLAAYRDLAADDQRLAAIEAGTAAAVEHGLL